MIAVDSGFLCALVDRKDAWHQRAAALAHSASQGWITTWPVPTEVGHLDPRWLSPHQAIPALMQHCAKPPMDLADASLVLLAEQLGHGRILSTDQRDVGAYRWKQQQPFDNLLAREPAPGDSP